MYPSVRVLQFEYRFELLSFSLPLSELLSFRPTLVRACLHYFCFGSIETIGWKRIPPKSPAPACPIPNTLRMTHLSEESHFLQDVRRQIQ